MKDITTLDHFQPLEQLTQILCDKTQNPNPLFFRVLVAYYFSKVASMMRVDVETHDRGTIPVNMYAVNLAVSGAGKNMSTSIVEEEVINKFQHVFLEQTFPLISEESIAKLAIKRAAKKSEDPDEELVRTKKEFIDLGPLAFSFDSATTAAVKQMRHKLLMAGAGSVNLELDEAGSNLSGNMDVFTAFLSLYDIGKIKEKLTKSTADNTRNEPINGRTPTNMMLFGTPSKLLNGSKTEDEFYSLLDTGFARRCFFGLSKTGASSEGLSAEQIYDLLTDTSARTFLEDLSDLLGNLAAPKNFGATIMINKAVSVLLIEYRMYCEERALAFADHEDIKKAEMNHRYYKTLKLAGVFAFIDSSPDITEEYLYNAICLAEESGLAFENILTRERDYVRLAKHIATLDSELTHADLVESLPFYTGTISTKKEMMSLAIAWGYKNNVVIKTVIADGIEFISGSTLEETNLDEMKVSFSTHVAENYENALVPFNELHKLTQAQGYHWVNHHLRSL